MTTVLEAKSHTSNINTFVAFLFNESTSITNEELPLGQSFLFRTLMWPDQTDQRLIDLRQMQITTWTMMAERSLKPEKFSQFFGQNEGFASDTLKIVEEALHSQELVSATRILDLVLNRSSLIPNAPSFFDVLITEDSVCANKQALIDELKNKNSLLVSNEEIKRLGSFSHDRSEAPYRFQLFTRVLGIDGTNGRGTGDLRVAIDTTLRAQ